MVIAVFSTVHALSNIGPRVYPVGSIVIVFVCLSSRRSVFRYLGDHSLIFLKYCMKLGVNKVKKVTRPKFWKKNINPGIKGD